MGISILEMLQVLFCLLFNLSHPTFPTCGFLWCPGCPSYCPCRMRRNMQTGSKTKLPEETCPKVHTHRKTGHKSSPEERLQGRTSHKVQKCPTHCVRKGLQTGA